MRHLLRVGGLAAAVTATLLATAVPSGAAVRMGHQAGGRAVQTGHISVTAVIGRLAKGSDISIVQTCPRGTTLLRGVTRRAGELHSSRVRLTSRELWPAGTVSRYRLKHAMPASSSLLLFNAAACRSVVPDGGTRVHGRATIDVRVWGPAKRRVRLINAALVVVADHLEDVNGNVYRVTMRAGGVNSNHASVRRAVTAMQDVFDDPVQPAVTATGRTHKAIARGQFASMQNHYRFVGHLGQVLTVF